MFTTAFVNVWNCTFSKKRLPYLDICQATFHCLFNASVISVFALFTVSLPGFIFWKQTLWTNAVHRQQNTNKDKEQFRRLFLSCTNTTCVLSHIQKQPQISLSLRVTLCDKHCIEHKLHTHKNFLTPEKFTQLQRLLTVLSVCLCSGHNWSSPLQVPL